MKVAREFRLPHPLDSGIFFLSALLTLMVSLGTLSFQAIKAAASNPVDSLRHE